ncbi:vitellogenin [Nomia melanderi]|uniref:vitellogenin n=1 Tax=Nomia melanderi TaxID=2448451 RepID=UPI003FCC8A49
MFRRCRSTLPVSGCPTTINMWLPLTLLVLAGTVSADFDHGWKVGKEYSYLVRSRTMTGLDKLGDQYTGVLLKALLKVQVKDPHTLIAQLSRGQFANIHKELPDGWDMPISDQMLDLQELPITGKPFEIKVKRGVIRDLIVEKGIPSYEVNLLKSVVSQLQVDTLGENAIRTRSNVQVPNEEEPYGSFPVMEDSVAGKCEVRYDITPLPDPMIQLKPELVPMPELKGDGHHIDIMKTKNFSKCEQRVDYHLGITGSTNWEPGTNDNGEFLSKSSTSRIVISGSLKRFTVQSSVTTSQLFVSPRFYDQQNGIVMSKMNLTLKRVNPISDRLTSPSEPESTGNLVFVYDNPFTDFAERRPGKPTDSNQLVTSDGVRSVSSSEEVRKNLLNIRGSGSGDSSSSIASSEDRGFWQPKPTLEDAPQNPLLPNYIGNKGKYIGNTGAIDTIKVSKDIIYQIANELEEASNIPKEQTLEKFTILTSLLRTLNRKQLAEVENSIQISINDLKTKDKTQAVKQNAWAVFRDAVTQAGTGPALLTIKKWIQNNHITGLEAASVISRIPKTALTPTAEYVRAMFELATSSEVKNDRTMCATAILAFTELVRLSQVNSRTLHNRYPVHTFGRMISKQDKTVVNEYIPYLARELKQAVTDRDSPKIQTYILALGSIAHPKILTVLEPYLEGKEQVTVFQRTLMVASLNKLADINPRLARSVLYKIYLNTMEAHEVRCAAVFLLMKTNPPVSMLQRMAEFTNYDTSKHVNSAVKSTLQSITTLTSPELKDLANKARAAVNLLDDNEYSYQYSRGFVSETVNNRQNMINRLILNYIGSDDSVIPRALFVKSYDSYGDFQVPPTELFAMLSSVRPILEMSLDSEEKEQSGKWLCEKLAEELHIIPEEPIEIEGNILLDSKFSSKFLPFDGRTLRKIPAWIREQIMAPKHGGYINLNKLMSYEVTLSFPTETGLPFVYMFKAPTLYKMSGQSQMNFGLDMSVNAKLDTRIVFSKKIQGRIGFLAPFEHQHFIAGVDMNLQAYAPIRLSADVNPVKGSMRVKLWPLKGEEHARLLHYSVVPFTASHDIFSQRPLLTEKTTHRIIGKMNSQKTFALPSKDIDSFRLEMEGCENDEEFWDWNKIDMENLLTFPWTDATDEFRSLNLVMRLQGEQKEPLILTVSKKERNEKPEEQQPWIPKAKAVVPTTTESNSEERREQFLKEVGKGIKAARSTVVDVELQIPGELESRNAFTAAWSESNADNKQKILLFWKINIPSEEFKYEVCSAINSVEPDNTIPSYEMAMKTLPKEEIDMDIRFGVNCADGEQINVKGQAVQSAEMRKEIEKSAVAKTCEEQMMQGNKVLRDCQTAAALAKIWDELHLSLNIDSEPLMYAVKMGIDMLSDSKYLDSTVHTTKPKNAGKNKIDITTKLSKDLDMMDVAIHTSDRDVHINDIGTDLFDVYPEDRNTDNDIPDLLDEDLQSSCVLDKTRAETFDGNSYPLRLGNCWHVLFTTYPKMNPEQPGEMQRVPEDLSVSILAKEVGDGRKEVKIMLGKREIVLLPGETEPEVLVDSQKVPISREKNFQERRKDEILLEINRLSDNSIAVVADKQDVQLIYDGKRIVIKASDDYRGAVRGLCGNFDGEAANDFVAPQNCMVRKSEHFIASYALTNQQCEGDSVVNAEEAKKECRPIAKARQSNVISDVDAGREIVEKWPYPRGEYKQIDKRCNTHKTQVEELEDQICFSTRPVVACAPGCSPVETKDKSYQFHCMEKNTASLDLKKRIEKGAMPDLSQKPVSMSRQINVPLMCKA